MFNSQSLIRTHIKDMPAYEPILPFEVLSGQLEMPPEQIVKLDANENPYGPHPAVRQALAELPYAHIYPDPDSRFLLKALSCRLGLPQELLLAGAGADELIDLLMRLLIEPGDAILNCPPTFGMYAFDGNLNNARVINIPRRPNFSLDLDRVLASVREEKPKIIFLASPNNPDGSLIPHEQLEQLLAQPVILALDEAYIEFAPPGSSVIGQVAESSNLVVLRTFSKWAGLAGLRIGYGAFPAGLTEHLWKIKQPYNVSTAASNAALVSLQHSADLEEIGLLLVTERQRLFEQLCEIPWLRPYPSHANFILCRVAGKDAAGIKNDLASQGILVRYFNKPGLQDHIRISVGKPEHTNALLTALKRY